MKKEKWPYISQRVGVMFWLFAGLCTALLVMLATFTLATGQWLWAAPAGAAVLGALLYLAYRWVYLPYKETAKVLQLFVSGYIVQGVFEQRLPMSPEFDQAMARFKELIDTKEMFNSSKRQAQYLALQNQINPHFLYNTLEGIRSETMQAGLDSVSSMTEALATFFRYTISNVENLVTLEDELGNIDNYYIIQRYRFGQRLSLVVEYDDPDNMDALHCRLPKLTLQPIVENAIHHGIERKLGSGEVRIKIETTPSRLIITVSDNGLGIDRQRLDELNNKFNQASIHYLNPRDKNQQGGIAMVNVNNRIQLLFGEDYGLHLYSTTGVGTDVEITLPRTTENIEDIYEKGSLTPG